MEGIFSWRHALALLITLTFAWLIWTGTHLVLTEPDHTAHTPLMHVSLAKPETPPAPPKVVPKPPKPVVTKQVASRAPVETSPHAIGPPVTNAPVASQTANPSPPALPTPTGPAENASLESTYRASVAEAINQQKRYPNSKDARLQQPTGTVVVWLTLDRQGNLLEAGIEQSAGSILDRAALESVHRATFAPIRDDLWPGQSKVRFTANQYFHPD